MAIKGLAKKSTYIIIAVAVLIATLWTFSDRIFVQPLSEEDLRVEVNDISNFLIALQEDCETLLERLEPLTKSNSKSPDVWRLKGICEYNLENYEEAKKSFEKVLKLDPENEPAQNYLATIGDIEIGATRIIPSRDNIDRDFVESKIINFDENIFEYSGGNLLPTGGPGILRFTASYFSDLSFNDTIEHISSILDGEGISYELQDVDSDAQATAVFNIVAERLEEGRTLGFSISIQAISPVDIAIFYEGRE